MIRVNELQEGKVYKAYDGEIDLFAVYKKEGNSLMCRKGERSWVGSSLDLFEILNLEFDEIGDEDSITGWRRDGDEKNVYYTIESDGNISPSLVWVNDSMDKKVYANANCFQTVRKAKEVRDDDILRRLMQRFADENSTEELDWENRQKPKFIIIYSYHMEKYIVKDVYGYKAESAVYFESGSIAQRCIDEIVLPFKNGEYKND